MPRHGSALTGRSALIRFSLLYKVLQSESTMQHSARFCDTFRFFLTAFGQVVLAAVRADCEALEYVGAELKAARSESTGPATSLQAGWI